MILQEESARRYLDLYSNGDDSKSKTFVKVHISKRLGPSEPFCVFWAHSIKPNNTTPYYLTYHELNKLMSNMGSCKIYGRTETGPWLQLRMFSYRVVEVRLLYAEDLREARRYMNEILYGG